MIDAHFHIWQLSRGDYGWLTPQAGPIYRDFTLQDWRRAHQGCGITGGILVQAAPTPAETAFLLQQAHQAEEVLGVVGWVDMPSEAAPQRIAALAGDTRLRGLRPMLQDIADADWILQPALDPAFRAMLAHDLTFDALVRPVHLTRIALLATRYPDLRIVLDHGAKPDIASRQWTDWAAGIERLALHPNVYCKLSGLWTECAAGAPVTDTAMYGRHLLACFGAPRLLWGSDWPVLELVGSYASWHGAASSLCAPAQVPQVFGDAARRAYHLQPPSGAT